MQRKSVLGLRRTHYGMFRGGNKGRKREGVKWFGVEQLWEIEGQGNNSCLSEGFLSCAYGDVSQTTGWMWFSLFEVHYQLFSSKGLLSMCLCAYGSLCCQQLEGVQVCEQVCDPK